MDIGQILKNLKNGEISLSEAELLIKRKPFEDMGFAKLDTNRRLRQGFSEVVFGQSKEKEHLLSIIEKVYELEGEVLVTRVSEEKARYILSKLPLANYDKISRILTLRDKEKEKEKEGNIAVCTAGTADIAVAEEAALSAEFFGTKVDRIYDVGVSGIHRLLSKLDRLNKANAVICIAGMEGALPSVVGGLVDVPVIAVPTSVGYGANFGGVSALLTMINSCANGISVVNIDNGYGAAYIATQINRLSVRGGKKSE
jgi:phosphoribosylcarboxyaminoimidazole (NCAIR) mutase